MKTLPILIWKTPRGPGGGGGAGRWDWGMPILSDPPWTKGGGCKQIQELMGTSLAWFVYWKKQGQGIMDQPFGPLPREEEMPGPRPFPGGRPSRALLLPVKLLRLGKFKRSPLGTPPWPQLLGCS